MGEWKTEREKREKHSSSVHFTPIHSVSLIASSFTRLSIPFVLAIAAVPSRIFWFDFHYIIIPIRWYKFHWKWKWNAFYIGSDVYLCSTLVTWLRFCNFECIAENSIFSFHFVRMVHYNLTHILVLLFEPNYYSFNIYRFIACFWFARPRFNNATRLLRQFIHNGIQRENTTFTHMGVVNWSSQMNIMRFLSVNHCLLFSYYQLVSRKITI